MAAHRFMLSFVSSQKIYPASAPPCLRYFRMSPHARYSRTKVCPSRSMVDCSSRCCSANRIWPPPQSFFRGISLSHFLCGLFCLPNRFSVGFIFLFLLVIRPLREGSFCSAFAETSRFTRRYSSFRMLMMSFLACGISAIRLLTFVLFGRTPWLSLHFHRWPGLGRLPCALVSLRFRRRFPERTLGRLPR